MSGYRVGFWLLALVTLGYQLNHSHNTNPDFRSVNFFRFFTVESNSFGALVLLASAWLVALLGRFRAQPAVAP